MTWRRVGFPPPTRRAILARDPICQACGTAPSTDADHIVPVAEGGSEHITNGQGLCAECHQVKSDAERQRGLARGNQRRPREQRKPEPHPGLID